MGAASHTGARWTAFCRFAEARAEREPGAIHLAIAAARETFGALSLWLGRAAARQSA